VIVGDSRMLAGAISGALLMGYVVAALFFTKFWRRTLLPLFGWFAVAFVLLAVQRAMLLAIDARPGGGDDVPWSYLVRLLAFVLLLVGIVAQNRTPRRRR
jgi:hypothetical protein